MIEKLESIEAARQAAKRQEFLFELNGHGFDFGNQNFNGSHFEDDQLQIVWEMWQAGQQSVLALIHKNNADSSDAQAETHVLVPLHCTNKMAHAAKSVDGRLSAFKYGDVWRAMVDEYLSEQVVSSRLEICEEKLKAMSDRALARYVNTGD